MSLTGSANTASTDPGDRVLYDTLMRRRRETPSTAFAFDDACRAAGAGDVAKERDALITLAAAAINEAARLPAPQRVEHPAEEASGPGSSSAA